MASPLSSLPPGFVLETPPDSARPARPKAPAPPPGFVLEQQPPTFETVPSVPLRRQQETAPPPGFVLKQAKEPAPQDNSSWLTDLQIGWENLKGSFATSDFLQSQEDLASAAKPFPAARGAPRPPTPLEVAQRLAAARKKEAKSLGAMAETQSALKNLPQSPAAQAFSNAETFGDAWNAMLADPWAVSRSTVLQSAPASIPSVVGGIAGSFLGPAGSAMGAGYGSYLTEIGGAIQEGLQQKGANLSDPESIASTWARHKDEIAQYAQTRAGIIGAADAATAGLSSKIGLTAPAKQWIKGELRRGILGTGVEAAGGMAGEAGAQLATTGELKPGQVLAEGLGEVVPGAIQVAGQTAVGRMAGNQVDGQPPPPSAPPPPRSRTEPRLFPDQPPGSQAGPATPPPQQAAPQADQPAPAPSAPSAPPAPPPGFVLEDAPPSGIDPGDEGYLLGAGYTPEQIADMNVPERAAAAQEARQQGVTPVTPSAAPPPPGTAPRAPRGTRQAKATIETAQDLDPVRPVVNPEPSEAQARAGNYQKAHVRIHGLDVSIENPRGSIRRGRDEDGRDWASPELPADYGYIKRTTGKDGDHVDVYIGPSPESDRVFVIDQLDLKTGKFDEHKSVLGASSLGQAVDLYVNSFDNPTLKRIGDVTEMSVDEFRQWVKEGRNTKRPAAKAGIGTVTPNPPEAPSEITGTPDAMQAAGQMPVAAPQQDAGSLPNSVSNPANSTFQAPVDQILPKTEFPVIQAELPDQPQIPAPQQDAPQYNPTTISGEVDDALKRYLGGTGPLTPEAFAKFAKIDASEAGKALQYAGLRGGIIIDKNGNWRRRRTFKGPANVLDFIASIGGIRDVTGELRGMDLPKMTQFGPVVRKKGLHPDRVREQLIEAGYLFEPGRGTDRQQQTTVADVYDLISQHMSGLQVVAAEDQAEADAIRVQKLNENMPDDWQPQNQVRARFGAEVWSDIEGFFARSGTTEESWGPDELLNAARLIAGGMEPDDAFERAAIQYHATLDDTEGLDPAFEAAFQSNNPNVMVAFEDVPFPDLETATNADQQQGPQETGDGAGPAGADRLDGAGQAVDADTAEEVRGPGARGGQEGGRGQDAGPVSPAAEPGAEGKPQLVIPGAERDVRGAMQNAAKAPLKSKSPQKGMDIGMFGSERDQTDIFDKRPEEVDPQPPTQTAASTKQQEAPENKDGAAEATPAQSLKSKSKKKESVKIDDFGEKILGARKDAVRSIVESLTAELDAESATVRQAFPQPNYEELAKAGVDKKAMALVALMRDVIPSKPHKKWKLKNWLAQLNTLRGFSGELLNGDITTDEVMKRLAESSAPLRSLADTVGVVAALPPNLIPFGARFRIHEGTFFVWKGVKRTPPLRTYYLKDEEGRQTDVDSQNLEDIQQIAAGYIQVKASKSEDKKAGRRTPINLYRDRKNNSIYLGFEGLSRQVIRLKSDFQSIQDARQYLADHADDLQRQIDDMREGGAVRRAANMPRKGENRRQGDVTPERFSDTFGFRGVQFGNYVEDDRRQSDLNETYDALMDMADILGIPPLSLSLNGELGLAFGARGHGGKYAAHYEPLQVVINLTKNRGAGSLAHEWLHAVDHYFNRQSGAGKNRGFISESRNQGDLREPVWIAWKAVEKAVEKGPFHNRAVEMDKAKSKPYWSTTIEKAARAFERYIVARLEDKGANNDYLANLDLDSPAYPTADELEGGGIRKAFDDLFSAIEIRWSPDRKQAALSSRPPQGTMQSAPSSPVLNSFRFAISDRQSRELTDEINQIAQRILGRRLAAVNVTRSLPGDEDAYFDPNTGVIYIALQSVLDPRFNIRHEAVHALRQAGVMSQQEWAVLSRMAKTRWIEEYGIRERYGDLYRERFDIAPDQLEELMVEEAIADAMAQHAMKPPADDVVSRIFQRVRQFLRAVANMLAGRGFTTPEQILSSIETGGMAQRRQGTGQGRGFLVPQRQESRQSPLSSVPPDDGGAGGRFYQAQAATTAEDRAMAEFAGNINLSKIDAAEDIKDVLRDAAEKANGFIAARRGVVSHDQTKELAEQLGMSLKQLLKRKSGQAFNAHEAYAARVMLVKSAEIVKKAAARAKNTTSDVDRAYFIRVLTRHAAIQEQVAGMTAEAGRALNQFKMMAGADYLRGVGEMLSEKTSRGNMGPEAVRDMAEMIDSLDTPGQVGRMTRDMFKPRFLDMVREYYINSLLSGPATQTVNFMSNMLVALNQIPETFVAEQIGKLHGGDKVSRGETMARAIGLLEGSREGLQLAWMALKTGEPQSPETQFDQPMQKAIPGIAGEVIRLPSRLMMSSDEFFKAVNYRAELTAIAVRTAQAEGLDGDALADRILDLRNNPTPAMVQRAAAAGKYQTFQNKLGTKGQTLMRFRESWQLWWLLPFLRTPINILKYAAERSPIGPLLMSEVRQNLRGENGGAARDTQIARIALGTVMLAGMGAIVMSGMATGGGSDDEREKGVMRADGWQPYSLNIGGKYYSYLRFDPFSLHLGIVSDMVELRNKISKGEYENLGWMLMASIINNVTDKTWLKSATEFSRMTMDPKAYMENYLSHLASGFVPNFLAQIARAKDPSFRDARGVLDKIKERIPGLRETLPQRYDIFGEPITGEGNVGPDLFSPVYVSTQKNNPIARAMVDAKYFPGKPRRHINGHDLTTEQYAEYTQISGKEAVRRLERMVKSPSWSQRSQDSKERVLKRGYDQAREIARKMLMQKYPELRARAEQTAGQ